MPLAPALCIWVLNKLVPQTTTHLPLEVGVCLASREGWVLEPLPCSGQALGEQTGQSQEW